MRAPDVDAVCIGTWPYMHREITEAALEHGKHVLCEARMAMNAAEGRRMLDAARRTPHRVAQLVPAPLRGRGARGRAPRVPGWLRRAWCAAALADASLSGLNVLNMGIW